MYKRFFKSFFDFWISFLSLICLFPFFLIISIVLMFANKRFNVFFLQERIGKNTKPFKAMKFKTMTDEKDENGELLPDKDRITNVGKFIRSTSIDELPQLFNILIGNMSLIGPRPLLKEYLPLYSAEQLRRHNVKPGLTGWAQINGRNDIPWKRKFELDVWYVDNLSFSLDLKIFFATFKKILLRESISKEGEATTQPFDGTN